MKLLLFYFAGKCPVDEGYLHFRETGGCYRPQPDKWGEYFTAVSACQNEGAYLVKFNNIDEKIAIHDLLTASSCR